MSSQIRTSTIIIACIGTTLAGLTAYAVYFDHKRRNDPDFRRALKRESKQSAKAAKEAVQDAKKQEKIDLRRMVDEMVAEGFETDALKKEAFFMKQVELGEALNKEPGAEKEAAACFFSALRVYPDPNDLMKIYDKTVPTHILNLVAEMEAYYHLAHHNGGRGAGSSSSSNAGVE